MTAPTSSAVESNIRSIASLEQVSEAHRSLTDRVADVIANFSGSMVFVYLHIAWFTLWFLVNTRVLPIFKPFDPFPFILLAMVVSVEGVMLSTFVLMKQNRMQRKTSERDHLNLQIDLLAEEEITKTLQLLRAVARHLQVPGVEADQALDEMTTTSSVDLLARHIQSDLPNP